MKTVWKFRIPIHSATFFLDVPEGAAVLTARSRMPEGSSVHEAHLWMLVDPRAEKTRRKFRVVMTGEEISDDYASRLAYVTTFAILGNRRTLHLFQEVER